MLGSVVTANCAVNKSSRKRLRICDVKEVCNVERTGWLAIENTNYPTLLREAPMPDSDVALRVGVHVLKPGVPEKPDVLLA